MIESLHRLTKPSFIIAGTLAIAAYVHACRQPMDWGELDGLPEADTQEPRPSYLQSLQQDLLEAAE